MAELGAIEEECQDESKDDINLSVDEPSVTEWDMNVMESTVSVDRPSDQNVAEVPPTKDARETIDLSVSMQSEDNVVDLTDKRVILAVRYADLRLECCKQL